MADTANKMKCPACGAEMNHHCDKLVYWSDSRNVQSSDPSLGGVVEEFHTCPKCGSVAFRPA